MQNVFSIFRDRGLFWLFVSIIVVLLIWLLKDILPPFVTGMGIAYVLNPTVTRLSSRGLSRTFSSLIILLLFLFVLIGIIITLSPVISRQVVDLIKDLPSYYDYARQSVQPYIHDFMNRLNPEQVAQIKEAAGSNVGTVFQSAQSVLLGVWDSGMAVIDILTFMVITPVVAFYCLRDWPNITRRLDSLWPRDYAPKMRQIFAEFDLRLAGFLRGQTLVCLSLGTFYAICLSIIGLKFGLAIGFIAGILSFIPYVGSTFGLFASVGVALAQSHGLPMPLMALGIFIIGQFIEGNFLTPKLVGERIGLHAVWVIFALLAGGKLFGFTGLLLAVPVAAMVGVLVRHSLRWYEDSDMYNGGNIIIK
jgi:predicted PurR-regulated permease PerM